MNIFMPYPNSLKSVASLDDRRLIKQILECRVVLDIAIGKKTGYSNHPVSVHYKDYPAFVCYYGRCACLEYRHRFNKVHKYTGYFMSMYSFLRDTTKKAFVHSVCFWFKRNQKLYS